MQNPGLFFSAQFTPAYGILRWQMMGMFLRILSWPLGYVAMAKGHGKLFFLTELAACTVHVCFLWLGINSFGLEGAGMAFCALYFFYSLMMICVVRRLSGFVLSRFNVVNTGSIVIMMLGIILLQNVLDQTAFIIAGTVLTCLVSVFCIRGICKLLGAEGIAQFRFRRKGTRCE